MLSTRSIAQVLRPTRLPVWPVAWGALGWGFDLVGLPSASRSLEQRFGGRVTPMQLPGEADPFLMLVHHRHTFSRWDPVRPLSRWLLPEGFPAHPHRGVMTVTYVLEGGMRHRDSTGQKMTYRQGSVQWLTAGKGVLHEEMWDTTQPVHELYQIWINLPRKHKFDPPSIQLLGPAECDPERPSHPLPCVEEDGVRTSVLAGNYRGTLSPVSVPTPVHLLHVQWTKKATWEWDELPAGHTALFHVRRGSVQVGERTVHAGELAFLTPSEEQRVRFLSSDADLLLLAGAPLREPVAIGGSMVMNTPAEVEQAHSDFQAGAFGVPWSPQASDEEWRAALFAPNPRTR